MRKPVYIAAGYNTTFYGSGRKEFSPSSMPSYESYLQEVAKGVTEQIADPAALDQGIIANFMAPRFIQQGNLPALLPFMIPELSLKPCFATEGACGSGGRAIALGVQAVLSDTADAVFVSGFEVQNTMKAVYGADVLAGAAYYRGERKKGPAFFFPGIFSERAGAYFSRYGKEKTRQAMARWYEMSILNARKNPKAQEYHNKAKNLYQLGCQPPNPKNFVEYLNLFDCSKVSDGASGIIIASEEGIEKLQIAKEQTALIVSVSAKQADLTKSAEDPTELNTTREAVQEALRAAHIGVKDLQVAELHDCFSITGLLSLEALGIAKKGEGPDWVLDGNGGADGTFAVNPSGGLSGFGHPTGATGVRQLVDLLHQHTGKAANPVSEKNRYGLMISMGGNDKTVTAVVSKRR